VWYAIVFLEKTHLPFNYVALSSCIVDQ